MVRTEYRVEVTLTLEEAQELRRVLNCEFNLSEKLLQLYHHLVETLPPLVY